MFVIMLIIPFIVSADTNDEEFVEVAKTVKYLKTVYVYNNSSVMRNANLGEMTSLTTEVTKEEFDSAPATTEPVAPLSEITPKVNMQTETNYKRLTTTIFSNGIFYRYEANLYWKNIPKVRSYDIIAIGHYNDVEINNPSYITFSQDYCISASSCYGGGTPTDVVQEFGSAQVFHLPNESIISLEQTMGFNVQKAVTWTVEEQVAAGDYAHATKATTAAFAAQNFGIGIGGLVLYNAIYSYYDTTPAAIAEWTGSW